MKLTIDQALQKAIAAHRAGEPSRAEGLYKGILEVQPSHFHANHNLVVLYVVTGRLIDSFELFATKIHTDPTTLQFQLSYIEALIKTDNSNDVSKALKTSHNFFQITQQSQP